MRAGNSSGQTTPEIISEGYPPSSFGAKEAGEIVVTVFDDVAVRQWNKAFFPLQTREEVRTYCRHNYIPAERAEQADIRLWLTKRGALVRATK